RDLRVLQEIHTAFLGRANSHVARMMIGLPRLPVEERKIRGRAINLVKKWLAEVHEARRRALEAAAESSLAADATEPGQQRPWVGHRHVLAQVRDELLDLFHGLCYAVYVSREVELDAYNFTRLNFPPDHPARDAHDTYFVEGADGVVLRTHTS